MKLYIIIREEEYQPSASLGFVRAVALSMLIGSAVLAVFIWKFLL